MENDELFATVKMFAVRDIYTDPLIQNSPPSMLLEQYENVHSFRWEMSRGEGTNIALTCFHGFTSKTSGDLYFSISTTSHFHLITSGRVFPNKDSLFFYANIAASHSRAIQSSHWNRDHSRLLYLLPPPNLKEVYESIERDLDIYRK